ncbi:MAG: N-acetylmuramyl-L-alanine amidase, negative regulator of AmpC, AmpD [Gemmatimonadetes bacterium]|nr:N-acetylmuramyl-L-alanine amidase, negative regulator of AmpC, AmpD [Gemmatimonadota bacterium]
MKIVNHLLVHDDGTPYRFVKTPNVGSGELKPRYLVMHFTAGGSAQESIGWLANPAAKASAHIVIAKDGTVTQMVPFNRVAWHAGQSTWEGIVGLNSSSIGIELDNAGRLTHKGGVWVADGGSRFTDDQVIQAVHKNEKTSSGWPKYPQVQLDVARELATLLVRIYRMGEVIGHEDISPGRKVDPGPAFPMADFRAQVMAAAAGGAAPAAQPAPAIPTAPGAWVYSATANLNVRTGPGKENPLVPGSPVPAGTLLDVTATSGDWMQVAVQGTVNGVAVRGWAAAQFLKREPDRIPVLKLADGTGALGGVS